MNARKYLVYIHTFPNGKVYIGMTGQRPEKRWQNGEHYEKQSLMYRAIKKYGWDNIKHETLIKGLTFEEAEQKEIELIKQYKSNNPKFGYNLCDGGHCRKSYVTSEETRQKLSLINKGKKRSLETRKKYSISKLGGKNPNARKVYCIELNKIYESLSVAANEIGCHYTTIRNCCVGKGKTAKGYHWRYVDDIS